MIPGVLAIAWDIDGTLVDSEPLHLRALQSISIKYNADISDLPDEEFVGVSLHGVWEALKNRYSNNVSQKRWAQELNDYYVVHSEELVTIPHAHDTVVALQKMGMVQVAVSNSNRIIVDANLKSAQLEACMAFSISLDDVAAGKPKAIPYQLALSRLGFKAYEVVAIEDSATGIESAVAAGLRSVGFEHNTSLPLADYAINCISEVLPLISSAFEREQ